MTFSSNGTDRHGDVIPGYVLEDMRDQIRSTPELRRFHRDHDPDSVIGEILDVWIEEGEDATLLRGEVGIFEGEDEALSDIASGDLGGVSVTLGQYHGVTEEEWGDASPSVRLEVPAGDRRLMEWLLGENDVGYRLSIEKSEVGGAAFEFLFENEESVRELVKLAVMYYLTKRADGVDIQLPDISLITFETTIDVSVLERRVIARLSSEYDESDTIEEEDIEEVLREEAQKMESE